MERSSSEVQLHPDGTGNSKQILAWLPTRYVFIFMLFCGNYVVYAMRWDLSITLVAMVRRGNTSQIQECPANDQPGSNHTHSLSPEFDWDESLQAWVLSAFFYGYVVTQIPGGRLAEVFSAKLIVLGAILGSSICTLLSPVTARWNVIAFCMCRVVLGLCQGTIYPAVCALYSRWLPNQQRSFLMAMAACGITVNNFINPSISANISNSAIAGGWPSVYYLFGGLGLLWCVLWMLLVKDRPEDHPRITKEELDYLIQNRNLCTVGRQKIPVPWRSMLTSLPVWAIIVEQFCASFGYYMLMTELPKYLSSGLRVSLPENGLTNSVIHAATLVVPVCAGLLADFLIRRGKLGLTTTRKVFTAIADLTTVCALSLVPIAKCNYDMVIGVLIFGVTFRSCDSAGQLPYILEVAPQFSGTVKGLVNVGNNIPGIIIPYIVSALLKHENSLASWATAFYLTAGIYLLGAVFYLIFASAEPQPWAQRDSCCRCNHEGPPSVQTRDDASNICCQCGKPILTFPPETDETQNEINENTRRRSSPFAPPCPEPLWGNTTLVEKL